MRILLVGEYSNVHNTLAHAFRELGHEVVVVSDGDGWKNYPRDIDISRKEGFLAGLKLRWKLMRKVLPQMKGFDVVHLINPQWIDVDPSLTETLNEYLKAHNRLFSLGVYGDDYYVLKGQSENVLEYSDTVCYKNPINVEANADRQEKWTVACKDICEKTVAQADCLIANLYEYYAFYKANGFGEKLHYIGSPIVINYDSTPRTFDGFVKILIGVQSKRAAIKGTDNIEPLLDRVDAENPHRLKFEKVVDVPFVEYVELLKKSDVLVDQLYSYTPAMNALEAMNQGIVTITGGEEEYYDFIGEKDLRPIINLKPFKNLQSLDTLKETLLDASLMRKKSQEGIEFVRKHHDAKKIAQQYIELWSGLLK